MKVKPVEFFIFKSIKNDLTNEKNNFFNRLHYASHKY